MPQTTIDKKAFRINLVVLASVILATISGSMFFNSLRNDIDSLTEATLGLKAAIEKNTAQITSDGRTVAALQATVTLVQQRLDQLERAVERR